MNHAHFMSSELKMAMVYTKMFVYVWLVFITIVIAMKLDKITKLMEDKKKSE